MCRICKWKEKVTSNILAFMSVMCKKPRRGIIFCGRPSGIPLAARFEPTHRITRTRRTMDLIFSALTIMVVGMAFVFLFLTIQVIFTNLFARFAKKYSYILPDPEPKKKAAPAARPASGPQASAPLQAEGELAAAIAGALHADGRI